MAVCLVWWGLGAAVLPVRADYEVPNFDTNLFNVDALSLSVEERDEVVLALAGLAAGDSLTTEVDDDLREKALYLALQLNPLNPAAREVHRQLSAGEGEATKAGGDAAFPENACGVLSGSGIRLLQEKAEPEDAKLALLLLEVVLGAEVELDQSAIKAFWEATAPKHEVSWGKAVACDPQSSPSMRRVASKLAAFSVAYAEKDRAVSQMAASKAPPAALDPFAEMETGPSNLGSNLPTAGSAPSIGKEPRIAELKRRDGSLIVVAGGGQPGTYHTVRVTLKVRDLSEFQDGRFGLFSEDEAQVQPMFMANADPERKGEGLKLAESALRERYDRLPTGVVAELSVESLPPGAGGEGAPEPAMAGEASTSLDLSLAALVLVESAFQGIQFDSTAAVGGFLAEGGLLGMGVDAVPLLEEAGRHEIRVLALPAAAEEFLPDATKEAGLELLVRPQLLAAADVEGLIRVLRANRADKIQKAIDDFSSVENLTPQRMTLENAATNQAVQRRLRGVLEAVPEHLSAAMLLRFGEEGSAGNSPANEFSGEPEPGSPMPPSAGSSPDTPKPPSSTGVMDEIEAVMLPLKTMADATSVVTIPGQVDALCGKARDLIRTRRTEVDVSMRNYMNQAENVLEAYKLFLDLSNRSTSIAQQRRRELREALANLSAERTRVEGMER